MSRSHGVIAAVVLIALLSSSTALARAHGGLGPLGGARFAFTRLFSLGGIHHARSSHRRHVRTVAVRTDHPRNSENSGRLGGAVDHRRIAAAAALAGWHGGRRANGWWQHADGGYGWIGPVFWPFAYSDIYDFTLWDAGTGVWEYGSTDIYAGIFAPYAQEELALYTESNGTGRRHPRVPPLEQLCGDVSQDITGASIEQIRQAIEPTDAQRAAFDDLRKALLSAAQVIQASCRTQTSITAPDRLAVMQQRIDALIKGELAVQSPLETLYNLLSDEQKSRFNALGKNRRELSDPNKAKAALSRACDGTEHADQRWPDDEIEAGLHPNDAQRTALEALKRAVLRADKILSNECEPKDAITPPARLAAIDRRLVAMQQAINIVSSQLEDFYAMLTDEQKAQFEAIGPKRAA